MRKKLKLITGAAAEGRAAARSGLARKANPYPQSAVEYRDQWFEGYDGAQDMVSEWKGKIR